MKRAKIVVAALLLTACSEVPRESTGGDLAVLARSGAGFEQAEPGFELEFPRDHGPHPGFRIEWWYLTANLSDATGRSYGVQWTLFRTASQPPGEVLSGNPWQDPQLFMAHFAITTPEDHVAFQRYARGGKHDGLAQAGVEARPFAAWLDDWSLQSTGSNWLPLSLHAGQAGSAVELTLNSDRPLLLQGENGFSQKHPDGGGSFYYSHPFLSAEGVLTTGGMTVPVSGVAWLDREWSSQFLQADQEGWDWFALHLDSGEKLMLFRLRANSTGDEEYLHGVLVQPDAAKQPLSADSIRLSVLDTARIAGRDLPMRWRIELTGAGRVLEVAALHPRQWLDVDFPYWEGAVRVTGEGPGSNGRGYLEMTGYPRAEN